MTGIVVKQASGAHVKRFLNKSSRFITSIITFIATLKDRADK